MKAAQRAFCAVLGLLVAPAWAAESVGLRFESVPVVDVVRAVYSDVAGLPVVMTAAALGNQERVTILLPKIERAAAMVQIEAVAARSGLQIRRSAGVVVVNKLEDRAENNSDFVYRPKERSVSYLVDLLSPLFPRGAFSYQRGVRQPADATHMAVAGSAPSNEKDTGDTAYSKIDKAPDVLIFKGTPNECARLDKLLGQLDTPTPELLVKAMVYEVTTTSTDRSAISLAASILGGKLAVGLPNGAAATPGDYSGVFKSATLTGIYDALSQDNRFKVVSQPQIRVASGSTGKLIVGTKTPVVTGTTLASNGTTVQSITYQPAGVILDLKVDARTETSELVIDQQISQFTATTNGVNDTPTLTTREVQTSVHLGNGEVLVLGGLDQDQTERDDSGLSWLPSFLHAKSEQRTKTEVLLFLQATRI